MKSYIVFNIKDWVRVNEFAIPFSLSIHFLQHIKISFKSHIVWKLSYELIWLINDDYVGKSAMFVWGWRAWDILIHSFISCSISHWFIEFCHPPETCPCDMWLSDIFSLHIWSRVLSFKLPSMWVHFNLQEHNIVKWSSTMFMHGGSMHACLIGVS